MTPLDMLQPGDKATIKAKHGYFEIIDSNPRGAFRRAAGGMIVTIRAIVKIKRLGDQGGVYFTLPDGKSGYSPSFTIF